MSEQRDSGAALRSTTWSRKRGTMLIVFAVVLGLMAAGLAFVNIRLEVLARQQLDSQLRTAHFATVQSLQNWHAGEELLHARIASNEGLRDLAAVAATPTGSAPPVGSRWSARASARASAYWVLSQLGATGNVSHFELTDTRGKRLVSTVSGVVGTVSPAMKQLSFRRALQRGDTAFSAPVASLAEADITDVTPVDNVPMVFAGVPVGRPGAAPHAYVLFGFEAAEVLAGATGLGLFGRSGHTFVTDRSGLVVSDTRLDDILVDQGRLAERPGRASLRLRATTPGSDDLTVPVREVVRSTSGVTLEPYVNMAGSTSVGAWTWLPEFGVGVVTEIDHDEAFRGLLAARETVNGLGLGAMALVLGLGVMVERARRNSAAHETQLRGVAMFDSLTGLPNRHAFRFHLERALYQADRKGEQIALLFIDLDNFKRVNDSLGHDVGDELLVEVARRLDLCVRSADLVAHGDASKLSATADDDTDQSRVARLGGDEFVLMLSDIHDSRGGAVVAQRMLDALAQPVEVRGHSLLVSPSIGIAVGPGDGRDVETLVKSADMAMYAAKEGGRNRFEFFSESMGENASEHLRLESRLRIALEAGDIEVHYQPVVDAATGVAASAEALARWTDSELGAVSPGRFVPVAETSGLIGALGSHVLRRACEDAVQWPCIDGASAAPSVAINVASEQFLNPGFVEEVRTVLADAGLSPDRLVLEITERVAMANTDDIMASLATLKKLGVTISMDDFGTGYSSLSYLSRLPIDVIKIDGSFIRGLPGDESTTVLAATIIAMGQRLGKRLVAEGVETEEQRLFLVSEGAHKLQGWLFARAMPAEEFVAWLGVQRAA